MTKATPDAPPEITDDVAPDAGPDVPMIVHHERYVDSAGVANVKTHGPMPVTEWEAYEKEHNL